MASAAQFSQNIRKRSSQIKNGSIRLVKQVSNAALRNLVLATPVDKGVTRSNWRVGIGAPTRATIPAYSPGKKLGIGERANASATIAVGKSRINAVRVGAGGLETSIYIANNSPAIDQLNINGRSKQNSAGFVQRALLEARVEVIPNFKFFEGSRGDDD